MRTAHSRLPRDGGANRRRALIGVAALAAGSGCIAGIKGPVHPNTDRAVPRRYVCFRTMEAPNIDGRQVERAWRDAPRTAPFVDIRGSAWSRPRLNTEAMLLWDEKNLYVAAILEEPHVWGTLTRRDAVVYHDNDFEVFIDPDGDGRSYFEIEINALGTVFDLLLERSYREGGPARHEWDVVGLLAAVFVDGTLNDPGDVDRG